VRELQVSDGRGTLYPHAACARCAAKHPHVQLRKTILMETHAIALVCVDEDTCYRRARRRRARELGIAA
jgi:hypothetical protein